jgi:hypothetical protein
LKLLDENLGKILEDIGIGKDFLSKSPICSVNKTRIDKWDCIKTKNFFAVKKKNFNNQQTIYRIGENLCHLLIG